MTNEEKIKSMSVEKLAEFIDGVFRAGGRFVDPPYCKEPCTKPVDYPCRHCAEEWLGEEAKE